MQALEALQAEYEDKKAEIAHKLEELVHQSEDIEEKEKRLQEREKEVRLEESHLAQLKSANALETEQLLQKQDSDLKKSIAKEEGDLEKLKR